MNKSIYCVKDALVGFGNIYICENDAVAVRDFKNAMNKYDLFKFSPSNFDLYKLGEFNAETGEISPVSPSIIVTGASISNLVTEGE